MTARKNDPVEAVVETVEMDAMDIGEWEGQQLTPQASDQKLAALVRQTTSMPAPRPVAVKVPAPPPARTVPSVVRRAPTALPTPPAGMPAAAVAKRTPTITIPAIQDRTPRPTPVTPATPTIVVAPPSPPPRPTPPPRALVMPLPAVVAPPETIIVEADEPPPPAPAPTPPTTADSSGAGPYSVAVFQPIAESPPPLAERSPSSPAWWSRRPVVLGAVGCVALVVILLVAVGGSSHAPTQKVATSKPPPTDVAPPAIVASAPTPVTAPSPVAAIDPIKPVAPAKPIAQPAPRPRIAGTKKLVLDYDKPAGPVPKPDANAKPDDQALAKARASYAIGNQRLFAGDPDGAVRAYQQALTAYPGYVAGYRGLGLAYAQLGNKSFALSAFRTYVSLVPNAKDIALVKKRIATLSP